MRSPAVTWEKNIENAFTNTPLSLSVPWYSSPPPRPEIWRKTVSNTWLLTLRRGKWLLSCNRIQAVKWFIPCWSLSHLIEHAVKLCRWVRRWNPALICCQGGRCFILLVCSLAFLTDMKQKQKKLNCCARSPLFSKVVLQLVSPVILWSVRRGMYLLTSLTTVLYACTGNLLYSFSCSFQHGWFSWYISCLSLLCT